MNNLNQTYLCLLTDVMKKKEAILEQLIVATLKQGSCFKDHELDEDHYDALFTEKEECIRNLKELDKGFDQLYERVREEIKDKKDFYKTEILALQELIKSVTQKGLQVERLEADNRRKFEDYINHHRRRIKEYKVSKKTAATYYQNMMKQNVVDPYFYDKTK